MCDGRLLAQARAENLRLRIELAGVRDRAARDAATAARIIGQAYAAKLLAGMAAKRLDAGDTSALIAAVQGIGAEIAELPA